MNPLVILLLILIAVALLSFSPTKDEYWLDRITVSRHYRFLGAARLLLLHLKKLVFQKVRSPIKL